MLFFEFCAAVLQLMAACGGRITSWGRSPYGNAEVGGVAFSYHQCLMAVDWEWSRKELELTTVADGEGRETDGYQRMVVMAPRLGLEVIKYKPTDGKRRVHLEPKES